MYVQYSFVQHREHAGLPALPRHISPSVTVVLGLAAMAQTAAFALG